MAPDTGLRSDRAMSIALRMAVWYAVSAFALISIATGILYWVLVTSPQQEDTRNLTEFLNASRLLLEASPPGQLLRRPDQDSSPASRHQSEIYLRILDPNARTILESPGMSDELPVPEETQLRSIATSDSQKYEVTSQTGKPFLIMIVRVTGRNSADPVYFMQGALDQAHDDYLLVRYREWLWIILGVSLILCSFVGYRIAKSGMRPIESIDRMASHIRSSTLHERIDPSGLPTELLGLAGNFNSMLDRLQESFARVSRFSDDVAHELRSPINNLRGEIEVALSTLRSSEEYQDTLDSCQEECERIARLIQSLLFLASVENAHEPLERENVEVGKALAAVHEFYEAAATEVGVDLHLSVIDDFRAPLDRTLFQQAVGNLVSNAIAHTPSGGTVQIAARANDSWLLLSVTDTGCGIAPEHLPHVFERFYRVDRARSGSGHNVGLGLALVKCIVDGHGGKVEIDSEVKRGTKVTLTFPLTLK